MEADAHVMTDVSISIGAVMKPAGLDASEGVLSGGLSEGRLRPAVEG